MEGLSAEAKLALLNGRVILADIERLEQRLLKSEELARGVLADPAVRGDRRVEADSRWAHEYALAMQVKMGEAEAERTRALAIESALAQGVAFPGVFADAKYHLYAGNAARALAILRQAVAKGFHDPIVLNDPTFASFARTRSSRLLPPPSRRAFDPGLQDSRFSLSDLPPRQVSLPNDSDRPAESAPRFVHALCVLLGACLTQKGLEIKATGMLKSSRIS